MAFKGFHRALQYTLFGFFALDMFAILMGMTMFDLVLRPILLLLIVTHGVCWMVKGSFRIPFLLILFGLLAAVPNEVMQRFYGMSGSSIAGTALYYGLFFLGFAGLRVVSISWRLVVPFAGLSVYMLILYQVIAVPAYQAVGLAYMLITTIMLGFAFYPFVMQPRNPAARTLALGGLLLLVSDTIRAIVFMRMGYYFGTFLVDNLLEALIVGLFLAGHFFAVRVMKPDFEVVKA